MTKKVKVLEIGASSLLDFDFTQDPEVTIEWVKSYNRTKPKFSSSLVPLKTVRALPSGFDRAMMGTDVVIFSLGNKGDRRKFHEYSQNDMHDLIESNFLITSEILRKVISYTLTKYSIKPLKVIFLNSVAGKEEASYENHSVYASLKAAMSSLVRTIKEEYNPKQIEFIDLKIPYTQSKMTGGNGESPEKLRNLILDLIKNKPNVNINL